MEVSSKPDRRIAMVTGAAGAIGSAIAGKLGNEGWKVAGLDLDEAKADLFLHVDVTDRTALKEADAEDLSLSLDEVKAMYARDIPLGRIGDPQEVAATVAFLAAQGGSIFSGRSLHINGGLSRCSR